MIVVDASAAILGLLNDGEARSRLGSDSLVCPHLIDSEIANALRAQANRGEIGSSDAYLALDTWSRMGVERIAVTGLLSRIWELRHNLSAYDASYVSIAEALDVTLLTADRRLAGAPGPTCSITAIRS